MIRSIGEGQPTTEPGAGEVEVSRRIDLESSCQLARENMIFYLAGRCVQKFRQYHGHDCPCISSLEINRVEAELGGQGEMYAFLKAFDARTFAGVREFCGQARGNISQQL